MCTMPLVMETLIQYSFQGTGYNSSLEPLLYNGAGALQISVTVARHRGRTQPYFMWLREQGVLHQPVPELVLILFSVAQSQSRMPHGIRHSSLSLLTTHWDGQSRSPLHHVGAAYDGQHVRPQKPVGPVPLHEFTVSGHKCMSLSLFLSSCFPPLLTYSVSLTVGHSTGLFYI